MKKLFIITVLMALAMGGFSQINYQFDFSYVCETGQTLFYRIIDEEEHTVMLTYPYSTNHSDFSGEYYQGYPIPQGEIVIPAIVTNDSIQYSVITIDQNTFFGCTNITSVFIPSSVTQITPGAFAHNEALGSISVDEENPAFYSENNAIIKRNDKTLVVGCMTTTIPDDVEIISHGAFLGSGNSGDLIIPNSVRVIEDYAFAYSGFSGSITLSESLETMGKYAFFYCNVSGSLTIPNSVTSIGERAFWNCRRLTGNLTLPSSISTIENTTFSGCRFSGTLIIPNSVNHIGVFAFDGNNFSELVLGNSVATIEHGAFLGCANLTGALRLPSSLTEIYSIAFKQTNFTEIYSPNSLPPMLVSNPFSGYDPNTPIHIPMGCTEAYQNDEGWNYFTNFIETEMNLEGEWYYEILNDDGSITYQHLEYAADTTIGTERPKIIVRTNTIYDRDAITTEVTHEYVFERDGKVYWWNKDLEEFTTLYDLTAEAGDEWKIKVGTESILVHVDSVGVFEYDGDTRKMLHISDAGGLFSGDIVVGYGHLTNFFPERLMNRGKGYRVEGLRCYWIGDELVYHDGDEDCDAIYAELHNGINEDGPSTGSGTFMVYPNPANNILFVETVCTPSLPDQTAYRITNLMGQTLLQGLISSETQQIDISNLPIGMYFISVDGQTVKFVVK